VTDEETGICTLFISIRSTAPTNCRDRRPRRTVGLTQTALYVYICLPLRGEGDRLRWRRRPKSAHNLYQFAQPPQPTVGTGYDTSYRCSTVRFEQAQTALFSSQAFSLGEGGRRSLTDEEIKIFASPLPLCSTLFIPLCVGHLRGISGDLGGMWG